MDEFSALLRSYRGRTGQSRNAVAKRAGIDGSYLTRMEQDARHPGLDVVGSLARVFQLPPADADRLFLAAGYAPPSLADFGTWDLGLQAYMEVMNDDALPLVDKAAFTHTICLLAQKWRVHP